MFWYCCKIAPIAVVSVTLNCGTASTTGFSVSFAGFPACPKHTPAVASVITRMALVFINLPAPSFSLFQHAKNNISSPTIVNATTFATNCNSQLTLPPHSPLVSIGPQFDPPTPGHEISFLFPEIFLCVYRDYRIRYAHPPFFGDIRIRGRRPEKACGRAPRVALAWSRRLDDVKRELLYTFFMPKPPTTLVAVRIPDSIVAKMDAEGSRSTIINKVLALYYNVPETVIQSTAAVIQSGTGDCARCGMPLVVWGPEHLHCVKCNRNYPKH